LQLGEEPSLVPAGKQPDRAIERLNDATERLNDTIESWGDMEKSFNDTMKSLNDASFGVFSVLNRRFSTR
jgi:hypothetical protein